MPVLLDRPFRIALLASQQLMPNLECVLGLAPSQWLRGVHTYCSDSEEYSVRPGRNLVRLLGIASGKAPFVRFEVEPPRAGPSSHFEDVRDWLHQRIASYPDDDWVLCATGGTKPMGAAFIGLTDLPAVRAVLYRELSESSWQLLEPSNGSLRTRVAEAFGMERAGEYLDHLALQDLIAGQFGDERARLESASIPPLRSEELTRLFDRWEQEPTLPLARCWQETGLAALPKPGEGFQFEHLLHGVLCTFGFSEVVLSLEVFWSNQGQQEKPRNEIDLLIKHRGRLAMLDLKLTPPEGSKAVSENDQIRTAAEVTRHMAGLGASSFMLRPNWFPDPDRRDYATQHKVTLIDAGAMSTCLELIARTLGHTGPVPLLAQRFQSLFQARQRIGLLTAIEREPIASTSTHRFVIDLEKEMDVRQRLQATNWSLIRRGGDLEFHLWQVREGCQTRPHGDFATLLRATREQGTPFPIARLGASAKRSSYLMRSVGRAQSRMLLDGLQAWMQSGVASIDFEEGKAVLEGLRSTGAQSGSNRSGGHRPRNQNHAKPQPSGKEPR